MNQLLIKKKGVAVPLVISVATIMLMYLITTWRASVEENRMIRHTQKVLQARLIALSGIQHFMLKARLMPTELYDAWALAAGRNPLFRFNDPGGAGPSNPGPRFISRGSQISPFECSVEPVDDFTTDPGGWFANCAFAGGSWPQIGGKPVVNSQLYLWKFCADVTSRDAIQPALAIKLSDGNPYDAAYEVTSFKLLGQKDYRAYHQDTITVEVKGTVIDHNGTTSSQRVNRTMIIHRN